jgi:hypothetical protein
MVACCAANMQWSIICSLSHITCCLVLALAACCMLLAACCLLLGASFTCVCHSNRLCSNSNCSWITGNARMATDCVPTQIAVGSLEMHVWHPTVFQLKLQLDHWKCMYGTRLCSNSNCSWITGNACMATDCVPTQIAVGSLEMHVWQPTVFQLKLQLDHWKCMYGNRLCSNSNCSAKDTQTIGFGHAKIVPLGAPDGSSWPQCQVGALLGSVG